MKNKMKFFGIIALVAIIGFSMAACPSGGGGGGGGSTTSSVTYTGKSADGSKYTLKITENTGRAAYTPKKGDRYELTVSGKKSTGSVETFSGGAFTLKPSNSEITFKASISGSDLTELSGTITWTDKQTTGVNGKDLNFITVSGTFNFTGKTEDIRITLTTKAGSHEDRKWLGSTDILNAGNNTSWSITIPSQSVDTPVTFYIYDFDGPMTNPWAYESFYVYYDTDLKVRNVNKSGVALNLITLSGTIDVNYNGSPVPKVEIQVYKNKSWEEWVAATELQSPRVGADVPWSIVMPAFASNAAISFFVKGLDRNDAELFVTDFINETTVRNANITGINFKLGDMKK